MIQNFVNVFSRPKNNINVILITNKYFFVNCFIDTVVFVWHIHVSNNDDLRDLQIVAI